MNDRETARGGFSEDGFTLVEIVMALVLLAILVRIGIGQFVNFNHEARTNVTRDKLNSLKAAIVGDSRLVASGKYSRPGYEVDCAGIPAALSDLTSMPGAGTCSVAYNPFTKRGWNGPYVSSTDPDWGLDAWSTTLDYQAGSRLIRSCGPDAVCGGGGAADDISVTF